jgi:hypothetical protein
MEGEQGRESANGPPMIPAYPFPYPSAARQRRMKSR